uniref:lysozyme n=1 Tax=Clastoptera arizonana TaxID=38151 RepID=A0A1B6E121_9HEMI
MATSHILASVLVIVAGLSLTSGQIQVQPVSELCLGCICEAISNCNRTVQCTGDVCGIFRITWAYWADAGKPTIGPQDDPESAQAYSACTNDPICAGRTVSNYLNKFAQDCNGDGVVNCYDYASIHRLGGYGCRGNLDLPFQERFINCQKQVAQYAPGAGF